jgi:hypothetical protein
MVYEFPRGEVKRTGGFIGRCGKQKSTPLDWSGQPWCFAQSELFRPNPAGSDARRVFIGGTRSRKSRHSRLATRPSQDAPPRVGE